MPIENWMLGGDIETTSGAGEQGVGTCCGPAEGGADTLLDFEVGGNCLWGERGEEAGDEREEVLRLRRAGEPCAARWGRLSPTASSSGKGPRVEWEEDAEETPDMAETDCFSSSFCWVRDATKEFWIVA